MIKKGDSKIFEKNKLTNALNVLYAKKDKKYPACAPTNKWRVLSCSKKNIYIYIYIYIYISALLREITSKYHSDF